MEELVTTWSTTSSACPKGTQGLQCEVNIDDCFEGACHHGGTCVDQIGGYECRCPAGYVGQRCEGDVNECLAKPCATQGTLECVQKINDFECVCKKGWSGLRCNVQIDYCGSHQCQCPKGYTGPNCEYFGSACDNKPCHNGGTCSDTDSGLGGYICACPLGTTGRQCELDTRNECDYNPCLKGQCVDKIGDFDCVCDQQWRGKKCDIRDETSPGGIDRENGRYEVVDVNEEIAKCQRNHCAAKAGDNRCDEECNSHFCNYDGGDCRLGINPWKMCNVTTRSGNNCWDVFNDGRCDAECNSKECLFDG